MIAAAWGSAAAFLAAVVAVVVAWHVLKLAGWLVEWAVRGRRPRW